MADDDWTDPAPPQRFGSYAPPSGLRGGVDEAETATKAARQLHKQEVLSRNIQVFTGAQFIAHLDADVKFNKHGDMIIQLMVPFEFKHLAIPLTDAFGLPLSVDVQIWQPYNEAVGDG